MINCLRYAGYHSLMCGSEVQVPAEEEGQNSDTYCNLKDHRFDAKTSAFPSLITVIYVMRILEKTTHSTHKRQPAYASAYTILCDVILPCSVMYCMKENKRLKRVASRQPRNI